jgi:hypothetical protein
MSAIKKEENSSANSKPVYRADAAHARQMFIIINEFVR